MKQRLGSLLAVVGILAVSLGVAVDKSLTSWLTLADLVVTVLVVPGVWLLVRMCREEDPPGTTTPSSATLWGFIVFLGVVAVGMAVFAVSLLLDPFTFFSDDGPVRVGGTMHRWAMVLPSLLMATTGAILAWSFYRRWRQNHR